MAEKLYLLKDFKSPAAHVQSIARRCGGVNGKCEFLCCFAMLGHTCRAYLAGVAIF